MKEGLKNCIQDGDIKKMNNGQNRERKKKERTLLKMTIVKNEQY